MFGSWLPPHIEDSLSRLAERKGQVRRTWARQPVLELLARIEHFHSLDIPRN